MSLFASYFSFLFSNAKFCIGFAERQIFVNAQLLICFRKVAIESLLIFNAVHFEDTGLMFETV